MQQIIKTLIFVIFMIFFLTTCDKDRPVVDPPIIPEDTSFCGYINDEKFGSTYFNLDTFVNRLSIFNLKVLEKIVEFVSRYECVAEENTWCNSCIYTLLPHSEIYIRYVFNDKKIKTILNIRRLIL